MRSCRLCCSSESPLGVDPGDTIACVGTHACLYDIHWVQFADVRILTEIYPHKPRIYASLATIPNRDEAFEIVRRAGAKVLVGYFSPGSLRTNGPWRQLDGTPYYALPLNLDAATGEHTAQR